MSTPPRTDGCRWHLPGSLLQSPLKSVSEERLEVKLPTVSQRGGTVMINWQVVGDLRSLYGYQVDVRKVLEADWRPVGSIVPHRGTQTSYSADLPGLEGNTEYYMRVRAVSADRATLATSPNVRLITQCTRK